MGNAVRWGICGRCPSVHPHACGERYEREQVEFERAGSSPRLWGTHRRHAGLGDVGRFIPTPVGNASTANKPGGGRAVHPHACGERSATASQTWLSSGSSPRLWGTRHLYGGEDRKSRFIPTPVGNASARRLAGRRKPVHPHACGERKLSTPRPAAAGRFIPTPVGNASASQGKNHPLPVHPHACGERFTGAVDSRLYNGSSPRLWGTPISRSHRRFPPRFIPTPVGNASSSIAAMIRRTVHPHACGERSGLMSRDSIRFGSSPRLWGTLRFDVQGLDQVRFIPTPVGNATRQPLHKAAMTVHPHACGER